MGVSIAQSIFNNRLSASLPIVAPDVDIGQVLAAGATGLKDAFSHAQLSGVLRAYMIGLKAAWVWSIALGGMAFIVSFFVEWRSIKQKDPPPPAAADSLLV
jgi:hypothetical protein